MVTKVKDRIAVIVVHGMGEQRPMETLRSFVDGVKWQLEQNNAAELNAAVRSKPDSIGDIYETTRLSMESCFATKRPITDFYEFYWAHNMRGTKFSQMGTWLRQVIFRKVKNVPPRLRKIWWTVWGIFVIAAVITLIFTFLIDAKPITKVLAPLLSGTLVSFLWTSVTSFFKSSFLNSLGDVARYMTPEPDNIGERSHIRQQGIAFLKKMHAIANRTKPTRIIVVAHSLGTVVAYDLLRLLWTEHNTIFGKPPADKQPKLSDVNAFAVNTGTISQPGIGNFSDAQLDCWKENHNLGNPWLITDFITLGAALNAADYFMVTSAAFSKLVEQRELPVCPPVPDAKQNIIYYRDKFEQPGVKRQKGINVLHHGALFAVTRWTNIFFTSDFVGGPMQRKFGPGVRDISIDRESVWFYPGGHTAYWDKDDKGHALSQIVEALKLS